MTEKRFKVQNMLKSFIIGDDTDLETLQELLEEYGSTTKIELFITDNNKKMTYGEVETLLNNLTDENKQLKQENGWLKSEIQKLYNFVKIDVDHNIEVYPKSLMEPILEILKIIGDVE